MVRPNSSNIYISVYIYTKKKKNHPLKLEIVLTISNLPKKYKKGTLILYSCTNNYKRLYLKLVREVLWHYIKMINILLKLIFMKDSNPGCKTGTFKNKIRFRWLNFVANFFQLSF